MHNLYHFPDDMIISPLKPTYRQEMSDFDTMNVLFQERQMSYYPFSHSTGGLSRSQAIVKPTLNSIKGAFS